MSAKTKHIKITKPTGQVSYVAFNQDTYDRLNNQNKNVAAERKSKIETVEISEEEIQKQSGYDEKAALEMNPTSAGLVKENEAQAKEIAELKAQLAKGKAGEEEKGGKAKGKAGDTDEQK